MGIIKDNEDNLEEENLTFFFDGSQKLNEFVLNKDVSNSGALESSSNIETSSVVKTHFINDNQTLKQLEEPIPVKDSGKDKKVLKRIEDNELSKINLTESSEQNLKTLEAKSIRSREDVSSNTVQNSSIDSGSKSNVNPSAAENSSVSSKSDLKKYSSLGKYPQDNWATDANSSAAP